MVLFELAPAGVDRQAPPMPARTERNAAAIGLEFFTASGGS
jgi:hypothetical protein